MATPTHLGSRPGELSEAGARRRSSFFNNLFRHGDVWRHLIMLLICVITFYPLVELLILSVKNNDQFALQPFLPTLPINWDNIPAAWDAVSPFIFNSVLYSGGSAIGVVLLSAFSAFVFARFRFPAKEVLYYAIIALLMIPGILTLIPSYILVKDLGLLNTRWVLLLPYVAGGQVFGIFLMRSFYAGLPEELFEAARLDGGGDLQVFWYVAMPLCLPIMGVLAILHVVGTWNDLIWPLVTISDPTLQNLTAGLVLFQGEYYTNWGPLFAGYVLAALPLVILFAFTSRLFIEGLSSGAIKA